MSLLLVWTHCTLPGEQFRHEVEKHLTGEDTEPSDIIYFKLYKSQAPVIEEAIDRDRRTHDWLRQIARLLLGDDLRGFFGWSFPEGTRT